MPRLLHEVAVGRGDGSYTRLMARLAKLDLLAIDDWMLAPLRDAERRDLTEVIEDRAERASTLIASQLPVTDWHAVIGDPNQADAICDRLLHDAHRIELKGPLDATHARRTEQPPEGDDVNTTTATPFAAAKRRPEPARRRHARPGPVGSDRPVDPAGVVENARDAFGVTERSPKARFPQHLGRRRRRPQAPQASSSMLSNTTSRVES